MVVQRRCNAIAGAVDIHDFARLGDCVCTREVNLRSRGSRARLHIVCHPVPMHGVVLAEPVVKPHLLDGHAAADADRLAPNAPA
ncbi:hypothetical protein SDC9_164656 [bioreactor metagenome]|uniref:Uncharacterized protein n=1 Tax=bioreactor metagenome TaxID=1076179 RepID=A0A645FZF5_9ZZZZ